MASGPAFVCVGRLALLGMDEPNVHRVVPGSGEWVRSCLFRFGIACSATGCRILVYTTCIVLAVRQYLLIDVPRENFTQLSVLMLDLTTTVLLDIHR